MTGTNEKTRPCKQCGAPTTRKGNTGRWPNYCSVACRRKAEMAQRKSPVVKHRKTLEAEAKRLTARINELRVSERGTFADLLDAVSGMKPADEREHLERILEEIMDALESLDAA